MQGKRSQNPPSAVSLSTSNEFLPWLLFLFRSSTNSVMRWLWRAWTASKHMKGEDERKTRQAIISSSERHLISTRTRLSSELLWWETSSALDSGFAVKYCINKTKRSLPFLSSVNVQYPGPWSESCTGFTFFIAIRLECFPSV